MADVLTWSKVLKFFNLTFMSGDTSVLISSVDTPWTSSLTVSGFMCDIINFATEAEMYIVPEAQDVHWSDGSGRATITLSPTRMDVNVTVANAEDFSGGDTAPTTTATVSIPSLLAGGVPVLVGIVTYNSGSELYEYSSGIQAVDTTHEYTLLQNSVITFLTVDDADPIDPEVYEGGTYIDSGEYSVAKDPATFSFGGGK